MDSEGWRRKGLEGVERVCRLPSDRRGVVGGSPTAVPRGNFFFVKRGEARLERRWLGAAAAARRHLTDGAQAGGDVVGVGREERGP